LLRPSTSTWTKVTAFTGQTPDGRRSFGNLAVVGCSCFVFGGQGRGTYNQLFRFEVSPEPDEVGTCQPSGAAATTTNCQLPTATTSQLSTPTPTSTTPAPTTTTATSTNQLSTLTAATYNSNNSNNSNNTPAPTTTLANRTSPFLSILWPVSIGP